MPLLCIFACRLWMKALLVCLSDGRPTTQPHLPGLAAAIHLRVLNWFVYRFLCVWLSVCLFAGPFVYVAWDVPLNVCVRQAGSLLCMTGAFDCLPCAYQPMVCLIVCFCCSSGVYMVGCCMVSRRLDDPLDYSPFKVVKQRGGFMLSSWPDVTRPVAWRHAMLIVGVDLSWHQLEARDH